jgi:AcrR family transcriptional regulator
VGIPTGRRVSIGTLYQYFPGKEALLYALVGRHLDKASDAVERACQAHRTMPVATCSDAFVNAYIDAKTGNPASYRGRYTMPRPSSS